MRAGVVHLVVGPADHGVVRCARDMADAAGGPMLVVDRADELRDALPTDAARFHLHFTDRLFGATATTGADRFCSLAATFGRPVGITLHDIPQASDGHAYPMRADAYRRVVAVAEGVVVSSAHERLLLGEFLDPIPDIRIIPLAIDQAAGASGHRPPRRNDVGVLGFVYPGKGHAEVIDAVARIDDEIGVVAIGAASAGHADLVTDLRSRAERAGVRFEITGFLDDRAMTTTLRSVAVPAAFHRHLSASGSINSWIAGARRPLVPRNRYTTEVEARSPGALWIHGDSVDDLQTAIERAMSEPELTWVDDTVVPFPSRQEAAAMYASLFEEWSR